MSRANRLGEPHQTTSGRSSDTEALSATTLGAVSRVATAAAAVHFPSPSRRYASPATGPSSDSRRSPSSSDLLIRVQTHGHTYSLPTTYYLLLTTYYSLFTTYYSLLNTHCLLLTAYCLLRTTHRLLRTTHYSLLTTHYSLLTAYCLLLTTQYSILNTQYSILNTQYSLLTTHLLVTNYRLPT